MYEDRIAKGAELLDAQIPGWRERIDLDKLELSNCTVCVLGQVTGKMDWEAALDFVGIEFSFDQVNAARYGFNLTPDEQYKFELTNQGVGWAKPVDMYNDLTKEWKAYIEQTREIP